MQLASLLILGLATYRISALLTSESGLFSVFVRLRDRLGVDPDLPPSEQPNQAAGILSCLWCCSLWVGLGISLLWYADPEITVKAMLPFALSAIAILSDSHA